MTTTLRVVLDQLVTPTDRFLETASRELAAALVETSPAGCEVTGIVPSGVDDIGMPGLAEVRRLGLGRRELAAAWQMGVSAGAPRGLIHAPTLLAPLVRHDRVNDNEQTVVTLWDLQAWDAASTMPRTTAVWTKAMLKRAEKHADAVVVPTHAIAERLADMTRLGARIRVIAGAAPADLAVPVDAIGRRRTLGVPEGCIVCAGDAGDSSALATGFAAVARAGLDLPVVVLDAPDDQMPDIASLAVDSGLRDGQVHVRGLLSDADRAAVFDAALAFVAPSRRSAFPWRVVEALRLGVPVIAVASPDHRETIVDGGLVVGETHSADADVDVLAEALQRGLASTDAADRLAVLAADRGRVFSWHEAADRVWQLHAEL
jgi:hypothetical protein